MKYLPSTNHFGNVTKKFLWYFLQHSEHLQTITVAKMKPNEMKILSQWRCCLGVRRHFNWLPSYRSGIHETVAKFITGSWKSRPEATETCKTKQKNLHRAHTSQFTNQSVSQSASQLGKPVNPPARQSCQMLFCFNSVLWEMMVWFRVGVA